MIGYTGIPGFAFDDGVRFISVGEFASSSHRSQHLWDNRVGVDIFGKLLMADECGNNHKRCRAIPSLVLMHLGTQPLLGLPRPHSSNPIDVRTVLTSLSPRLFSEVCCSATNASFLGEPCDDTHIPRT